jgi:putative copper resistance protein D
MLLRWLLQSMDESGPVILQNVLRRFSNLGLVLVATLVITGALNAYFILGSADALFAGDYGRALLAKLALFVVMAMIAAINRLKLTPDLASASADPRLRARTARRIHANALAEIGLGIAIIVLVGWLGILAPGVTAHAHLH